MKIDLREHFSSIADFLREWDFLYDKEFLKKYPNPYPKQISEWIREISSWDPAQFAALESSPHEDLVEGPSFKTYLETIRKLSELENREQTPKELGRELNLKISEKKQHELELVKAIVNHDSYDEIIDVGGGVGYLSCSLLEDSQLKSICIDMNSDLQSAGERFSSKALGEKSQNIKFINAKFDDQLSLDNLSANSMAISLHGCGKLSSDVIKFAISNSLKGVLNFGCCYHKLEGAYNLSAFSKNNNLVFTTNALHLASRCARQVSSEDIVTRMRFKRYRYSLHYYLYQNFGKTFSALGNAKKTDYTGSFSKYAKKFAPEHLSNILDSDLDAFFEDLNTVETFKANFAADLIRLFLGRLIELYIVLDRAIFLEESGRDVQVVEVFDRKLSPRNIMILSES